MLLWLSDANVKALSFDGPSGVTIRRNGRSFASSLHSRVHDSLPFGGRCAKSFLTLEIFLNALSAMPWTMTQTQNCSLAPGVL